MAVQMTPTLTDEAVAKLQELIQLNIDSRDGFRHAADNVEDMALVGAFEQLSFDRNAQAGELSKIVSWNGDEPHRDGSYAAAMHRSWMSIRELLTANDRYAVLAEAERGEDTIKAAYEKALQCCSNTPVTGVLSEQYAAVKAAHDRIRDLRDACKECA